MTDGIFVRHCAPTLAGIKTGSLFSCAFSEKTIMCAAVRRWNLLLRKCGLRVLPLRQKRERWLIYVYRRSHLRADLRLPAAANLLRVCGYKTTAEADCLCNLMRRLQSFQNFPHEIGLFLGYPPEDVRGFIERGPHKAKYTGAWRVYGDVTKAREQFAVYERCTAVCCARLDAGISIDRLAVSDGYGRTFTAL